jgi:hypothetical protein
MVHEACATPEADLYRKNSAFTPIKRGMKWPARWFRSGRRDHFRPLRVSFDDEGTPDANRADRKRRLTALHV